MLQRKPTEVAIELDKIDRRLLRELQRDNQLTNLELAERVHLSPPTCMRRVRRLRDAMVIVADVSLIDPEKIGRSFSVFVEVVLERHNDEAQRAFELKMQQTPEVMECHMVSGAVDFLVVVQVADMQTYQQFVRAVLHNDPNIKTVHSLFGMNRSKYRIGVNLEGI